MSIIHQCLAACFGTKLLVLGHNKAGKTTLQILLREGRLERYYTSTSIIEPIKPGYYKNGKVKFYLKKGIDINGDEVYIHNLDFWIRNSKYIIFLFDVSLVYKNDSATIKYLESVLPKIATLSKKYHKQLFVVGNFTDKIFNFDLRRKEIKNTIRRNLVNAIEEAGFKFKDIVFGNMGSKEAAVELLEAIYNQRKKNRKRKIRKIVVKLLFIILIGLLIYLYIQNQQFREQINELKTMVEAYFKNK